MTDIKFKKARSKNNVKNDKEDNLGVSMQDIIFRQRSSILNTLRRPIYCPNTECNKIIAMTQLVTHFMFEHSRIPRDFLELNQPHTLGVSLNSMAHGKAHCIALLLIPTQKITTQEQTDNCIVFSLMAAKIRCSPISNTENKKESDKSDSKEHGDQLTHLTDLVMFWMCGNVDENFRCFIEISDDSKCLVYSRFGSINSFTEENNPTEVFLKGNYLIVPSSNVKTITRNGIYPIVLKVIISFPY